MHRSSINLSTTTSYLLLHDAMAPNNAERTYIMVKVRAMSITKL